MSVEPDPSRRGWIAGAAVVVVVAAIAVAYVMSRAESGDDVVVTPSPTPAEPATSEPTAAPSAAEEPTAEPTQPPATTEPATEPTGPQPDEQDVAAFAAQHGPADRTATGDVTGDGVDEVVLASIRNNAVRIVVGTWDGSAYRRTFRDDGGPAQQIAELTVADYNGEPGAEIVTEQTAGTEGRSLSVWGPADGGIERQRAKGGCWSGFHTYGISGATIEAGRITATCDGSPEPPGSWASDIYEWRKGRWRYAGSEEPQG